MQEPSVRFHEPKWQERWMDCSEAESKRVAVKDTQQGSLKKTHESAHQRVRVKFSLCYEAHRPFYDSPSSTETFFSSFPLLLPLLWPQRDAKQQVVRRRENRLTTLIAKGRQFACN